MPTYIYLSIVITVLIAVSKAMPRDPQSERKNKIGILLVVSMFIFNIIYTAAFGWNSIAHSTSEWILDTVNGIIFLLGSLMMFSGTRRLKRKGD